MKRASLVMITLLGCCLSVLAQAKHYEAPAFTADFPGQNEIKYAPQTTKDGAGNQVTVNTYTQSFDAGYVFIMYFISNTPSTYNYDGSVQVTIREMCTDRGGTVSDFERKAAKIGFIDGEQFKFACTSADGKAAHLMGRIAFLPPGTLWSAAWATDDDQTARGEAFLDSIIVKRR